MAAPSFLNQCQRLKLSSSCFTAKSLTTDLSPQTIYYLCFVAESLMPVLRIRLRKSKLFLIKVKMFLYCFQFPPYKIQYLCESSLSSGTWSLPLFVLPVSGFQIHMHKDVHAFSNSETCWMEFPSACIQFYSSHWVIMELIIFPA